jgi:asparagine synthase (glutamine-hydrolysing)
VNETADTPIERLLGTLAQRGASSQDRLGVPFLRHGARVHIDRGSKVGIAKARGHWIAQDGDLIAAIAGKPQFEGRVAGDPARRLLAEFRSVGRAVLDRIKGTFALAIVNSPAAQAVLAIDRMGVETMAYGTVGGDFAFGTRADSVAALLGRETDIDPQAVFDYLFFHMVPAPETIFRDVHKLLPGQYVEFCDGTVNADFYWRMRYVDTPEIPQSELTERFRALLPISVSRQLDSVPVGTFLSGGTDSSTVTGLLSKQQPAPVDAYSIGFDADGFDEMAYARIAAKRYAARHHAYYVTPQDVVNAVPRVAAAYDEPFGNASAVGVYYCALRARQDGIRVMLAGDGGDELFGGNARYAKQKIFEAYRLVPRAIRTRLLEPLALQMPALQSLSPVRKLRSYVEQARIPLPDRLESYNFLCRADLASMLEAEFLASIQPDHPSTLMREVYERTESRSALNRMMHLDLKQTLADNDLRKVSVMCRLAGIDVRYPMLDDELVALSGMVPPSGKVKGTRLRPFFKESLRDLLPAEVIAKAKHGFGLPFGVWMLGHAPLYELAGDSLAAFRARGYLRPAYLDRLLEQQRRSGHASYYGVMVWVITMLEQWLRSLQLARADNRAELRSGAYAE